MQIKSNQICSYRFAWSEDKLITDYFLREKPTSWAIVRQPKSACGRFLRMLQSDWFFFRSCGTVNGIVVWWATLLYSFKHEKSKRYLPTFFFLNGCSIFQMTTVRLLAKSIEMQINKKSRVYNYFETLCIIHELRQSYLINRKRQKTKPDKENENIRLLVLKWTFLHRTLWLRSRDHHLIRWWSLATF